MSVRRALCAIVLAGLALWGAGFWPSSTPREWVNPIDGSEMVWVPAGPFTMGSDDGEYDERPAHTVNLDGYWIGKYPITNKQFAVFINAMGNKTEHSIPWLDSRQHYGLTVQNGHASVISGWDMMPVAAVSWHGARAYCQWAGLRLPTEAEWEKAARGTDGRTYPWGNTWSAGMARTAEEADAKFIDVPPPPNSEPRLTAVTARSQSVSPYGCWDMAGNVWEWCSSQYVVYPYKADDGRENLDDEGARVIRGGAWYLPHLYARTTNRYRKFPNTFEYFQKGANGFRPARSESATATPTVSLPLTPHPPDLIAPTQRAQLTPQDDAKYRLKADGHYEPGTIYGYPVTTERAMRYPMQWERLRELMGYQRNENARPDERVDMLGIKPTDVVADIGAGSGNFTVWLASKVPRGKVWATDISVSALQFLQQRLKEESINNVYLDLHDVTDPLLAPHSIDVAFMSEVHYFYYPRAKPGASPSKQDVVRYYRCIRRALKPGGHFSLVETSDVSPDQDANRGKLTKAEIVDQMRLAGFDCKAYQRLDFWLPPPIPLEKAFMSYSEFLLTFTPRPDAK